MKKVLMVIGAALAMAACSESSTAPLPHKAATSKAASDEITCRSGYVVAYDENGNPYCAPAGGDSATRLP